MIEVEPLRPGERTSGTSSSLGRAGGARLPLDRLPQTCSSTTSAARPSTWSRARRARFAASCRSCGPAASRRAASATRSPSTEATAHRCAVRRQRPRPWSKPGTSEPPTRRPWRRRWSSNPFAAQPGPDARPHDLTDERISQVTPLPAGADEEASDGPDGIRARGETYARPSGSESKSSIDHHALGTLWPHPRREHGGDRRPGQGARLLRPRCPAICGRATSSISGSPGTGTRSWPGCSCSTSAPSPSTSLPPSPKSIAATSRSRRSSFERWRTQPPAGFRRWNWGGTWLAQDGVYRFKRKWGAAKRRVPLLRLSSTTTACWTPSRRSSSASFGHFYVVPFSALRERGGSKSPRSSSSAPAASPRWSTST